MSKIVTPEQAKKLKDFGFDLWSQFSYYKNDVTYRVTPKKFTSDFIAAPTVSEALDWVREKKGIHCSVSFVFKYNDRTDNVDAQYFGQVLQTFPLFIDQVTEEFDTHPLASSALLYAVLTYLEQKEKP